ncbi:Protein transport protein Sec24-like [Glycine soja]|nr:Protein transport protein Sec24-like [Glycine soja]
MGTENPCRPTYPSRPPFAAAAQGVTPFAPTGGAMVGLEPPSFRPTPPAPPLASTPFSSSGPAVRPWVPHFRPVPPGQFNDPSVPPPPSNFPPAGGPFQHFPGQHFSSNAQAPSPHVPPMGQPAIQPSAGQTHPFPPSLQPQPWPQSQSMGSPSPALSGSSAPPPVFQLSFPGYAQKQAGADIQAPPMHSSHPSNQGNYGPIPPAASLPFQPHQGGYVSQPPMAAPLGIQPMQHPGSGPPIGDVQGLTEDFNSLSIQARPGLVESSIDANELPRPLDGDGEPKSLSEMYPMNCNSRYLRLTTSAIPISQSLCSRWPLPLGAVVCPLAEYPDGEEVPIVNFAASAVVRCRRCCTYVNPYVTFTEGGRKFRCNTCSLLNEVPSEYYAQLDATGRRIDLNQRPELTKGTVEYVAPIDYMVRPPMPPVYFFLIDVSITAFRSGMIEVVAQTIRSCLDELPGFPRTQIGFATFDSTIHFYNMKSSLAQPQMLVVSDLDDIFVPLPDDLLVSESRSVVETFLDSLPSMFQDNMNLESAFGPALKAAFMIMSQLGGKLLIFQNTLPSLGVGRLKLRGDDSKVYGTDKEHVLRLPEDPFYKQMAAEFSKCQILVNMYAFSDKYTDIASLVKYLQFLQLLRTLAKYTVGQVYYYPAFQSVIHGEKLQNELRRDLTRETGWEAVLRIRCAKVIEKTLSHKLEEARSVVQLRIVKGLPEYRNLYAVQHCLVNRMIYLESLKFLPLSGLALCRSTPLRGGYGDVPLDEQCAAGHTMMTLPIKVLFKLLYPSLLRIDEYLLKVTLKDNDNEMSRKLKKVLKKFRSTDRAYYQLCHVVRQGEHPREGFLLSNLFEDQMGANIGYADRMLQISRQVHQA